jgi:hypothetical protein
MNNLSIKNIFLFLFSICIYALVGCGGCEKTLPSPSIDDNVNPSAIEEMPKKPTQNPLNELSLENFEKLPGVDYRGSVVDKYYWEDELGHNYIIATEYKSANDLELDLESEEWQNDPIMPDYSEVCIKSYISNNGKLQQLYNFCDNTKLPLTTIEYIDKSIETTDLDKDGQVEIYYMYSIVPDGIDPAQVSLVISYKSDKSIITGILPIGKDDANLAFEKTYDDKFNSLPIDIQTHAQKKWDKTMQQASEQYQ